MRCVVASCLVAACGLPLSALAQGPFTQSQSLDIAQLSITGDNRVDRPVFVSDAGDVFGVTRTQVSVSGNDFETSAIWRANPAGADILTLAGPQFAEPTTGAFINFALDVNAAGQATGVQYSTSVPQALFDRLNAWFFDGTTTRAIGIRAADIASVTPFTEDLVPVALSDTGAVIGRYTSTVPPPSDSLPFGAIINVGWVSFNGVNTPLGLATGPYLRPFVNQRSSGVSAINNRNQIAGHSDRFNANAEIEGRTAWRYDLATGQYVTMGLSGPDYVDPAQGVLGASIATMIADDGTVAGIADIVPDSRATGVWVFRANQTVEVGLRGPEFGFAGREPSSQLLMLTNTGIALGTTSRELVEGFAGDVVWAAVDGVTRRMGPSTPDFIGPAGEEISDFSDANDRGLVAGNTQTYDLAQGTFGLSRLAWVQNAESTSPATVLALTDALHTGPTGQRASEVLDINNEGFVLGRSFQFGSPRLPNGGIPASANTPWLYDSRTGTLTAVPIPPTRAGRSSGFGLYLTPRGGVVGLFLTEVASDDTESYRPFYWSANAGFVDLAPAGPVYTSPWDTDFPIAVSPDGTRVVVGATLLTGDINLLRININDIAGCDSIDFNNNQVFPEEQDVIDFFTVLAGGACSTQNCSDIDFNNNQVFPEEQDIIDFFNVLAGGACS